MWVRGLYAWTGTTQHTKATLSNSHAILLHRDASEHALGRTCNSGMVEAQLEPPDSIIVLTKLEL